MKSCLSGKSAQRAECAVYIRVVFSSSANNGINRVRHTRKKIGVFYHLSIFLAMHAVAPMNSRKHPATLRPSDCARTGRCMRHVRDDGRIEAVYLL